MSDNGLLVEIQGVDKVFRRGSEEVHVLGGLDLDGPRAQPARVMVVGPQGHRPTRGRTRPAAHAGG